MSYVGLTTSMMGLPWTAEKSELQASDVMSGPQSRLHGSNGTVSQHTCYLRAREESRLFGGASSGPSRQQSNKPTETVTALTHCAMLGPRMHTSLLRSCFRTLSFPACATWAMGTSSVEAGWGACCRMERARMSARQRTESRGRRTLLLGAARDGAATHMQSALQIGGKAYRW